MQAPQLVHFSGSTTAAPLGPMDMAPNWQAFTQEPKPRQPKRALQRTGSHLGGREAVMHAHILKALLGSLAAVAADEGHLTLTGGSSHAHDLSDGGSIVGAGGSAGVDRSVAGQNGGSTAARSRGSRSRRSSRRPDG